MQVMLNKVLAEKDFTDVIKSALVLQNVYSKRDKKQHSDIIPQIKATVFHILDHSGLYKHWFEHRLNHVNK